MATRRTKTPAQRLEEYTQGLKLTNAQRNAIARQLSKGVSRAGLMVPVQGFEQVSLREYETAQRLIRQQKEYKHTGGVGKGIKTPRKVEGGYINNYGVFISNEERKELERASRYARRYQEKLQFETTLARVQKISKETGGRGEPTFATRTIYNTSRGISNIRSHSDLQKRITKLFSIQLSTEFSIAQTQRENTIAAYRRITGSYADPQIIRMLNDLSARQFLLAQDSGELANVGDIYVTTSNQIESLNNRLRGELEGLLGRSENSGKNGES